MTRYAQAAESAAAITSASHNASRESTDHNRRPIQGFADGFTYICGVTFTKSMLDVALLRLRSIWLVSLHLHPPHSPRSTDAVED